MYSNKYYQELSKVESLSNDELLNEFRLFKNGNQESLNRIVKSNLKLVVVIAKDYQTESIDDLISEGNIGLIEAAKRFNMDRNVKFSHYARIWIKKFMNDFIINDNTIRIQHNKYYEMKKNNEILVKMLDDFEQIFDRLEDESEDESESYDSENYEKIIKAGKLLKPIENKILMCYYGIGCERKSLVEIAQELGRTNQRIGQIKKNAIRKIRKTLGL